MKPSSLSSLTVDGRAATVLQEPDEYERLLDHVEQLEVQEAIRRGLEDCDAGRVRPAAEVFAEMRRKLVAPR